MSSPKPNTKATTTTTTIHKHEMAKMSKTRCCAWVLRRYVYRDAAVKLLTASTSHWTSPHSDRLTQGHTNTNTTIHNHLCDSTARYRTRYRSRYRTRYRTRRMSKTRCCAGYSKVVYRDAGCGSVQRVTLGINTSLAIFQRCPIRCGQLHSARHLATS